MAPRDRHLPAQEGEIHGFPLNSGSMSTFRKSKNSKRSAESIYDMLHMVSQVCVCVSVCVCVCVRLLLSELRGFGRGFITHRTNLGCLLMFFFYG